MASGMIELLDESHGLQDVMEGPTKVAVIDDSPHAQRRPSLLGGFELHRGEVESGKEGERVSLPDSIEGAMRLAKSAAHI